MRNQLVQLQLLTEVLALGNDQIRFDLIFKQSRPKLKSSSYQRLEIIKTRGSGLFIKNGVHYSWEKHNILSTKDFGEQVLEERNLNIRSTTS
jgi:argininosuccinate synthase